MTLALVGDPTAVDWSAMSQHTTGVIPRRAVNDRPLRVLRQHCAANVKATLIKDR